MLDFDKRQIILAEVTTAWNLRALAEKAIQLHDEGKEKVRKQLGAVKSFPDITDWEIKIQLFVREDRMKDLEAQLKGRIPFEIVTLEDAFRRWKW